jgi:glycosidase
MKMKSPTRPAIYQLFVRTFGNSNERRALNGTIEENGCGKFVDITDKALESLRALGFTHVWLAGVLDHASGTAYPGHPADDPAILKGIAGSPYAVRDYFNVSPDYAIEPKRRLQEFEELLARCARAGLEVLIDFVPNHVARTYRSDTRPEWNLGDGDDPSVFFDRNNHFYYLRPYDSGGGPPLKLPVPGGACVFEPECAAGRVTGNNAVTWSPSVFDWYETVKLNYGHDFLSGRDTSHLPGADATIAEVPRTWRVMDEVLAWWQARGVGGFRVDMAHLIPLEFWRWALRRARSRRADAWFMGEAYDDDPAKLCDDHVLEELLRAGFNAVYDAPVHKVLIGLYEHGKWANDLDAWTSNEPLFHRSVRYGENHDEVRLANPHHWGGYGMKIGRPVCAVLFGLGRGPMLVYNGQEVGEPALARLGFGGDNGRTSIFDYGSMPELTKWVNCGRFDGARLSREQKDLREWYGRLLRLMQNPAFAQGDFFGLNLANSHNPAFGRIDDETVSGHWLYAFLRHDRQTHQAFLVVANFHGERTLQDVRVWIPPEAERWLAREGLLHWHFHDRLGDWWTGHGAGELEHGGLALPDLAPCSAMVLEIR